MWLKVAVHKPTRETLLMDTSQVPLEQIALHCHEETRKFTLHTAFVTDYCMELMRRALLRRIPDAFTRLYDIYEPLVRKWVYQHHQFRWTDEDAAYFANAALTQFYFAVSGSKFERFETVAQLLQYLKRCVYTSIAMHVRTAQTQVAAVPLPTDDLAPAMQPSWDANLNAQTLWARVCVLLPDENDQLLARWCFIEDLKPADILREQLGHWDDVRDISVALQRIRRRLRGDEVLLALLRDVRDEKQG